MQLVFKYPDAVPAQREKDLSVVVVCEDGATAPRACALLHRVGLDVEPEGRLLYSWWTFAVLASPALRHLASMAAAASDIMVVAAYDGKRLPGAVKDYIRLWLANRQKDARPRALMALLESVPKHDGASCGALSELKHLAESGGVDFFANGDEVSSNAQLLVGSNPPSGNSPAGALCGLPGAPQTERWLRA